MQLEALRSYAVQRGWEITAEIRDVGSGSIERPRREQLLKAARRREIDAVLVILRFLSSRLAQTLGFSKGIMTT
jgi:DNA invertase Pin-like site-specific DNA recombinase